MKKFFGLALVALLTVSFAGCASMRKNNNDLELQTLRNQVSVLENQVASKDEEINSLKDALNQVSLQAQAAGAREGDLKSRPKARDIQEALRNAGYYSGIVDGVMGKQTRQAIRDFQRANNLPADGKVGKKTWALLKAYLEKKIK